MVVTAQVGKVQKTLVPVIVADAAAAQIQAAATKRGLRQLAGMTLTVVDGDFPREVLAGQNLVFSDYKMPARRNTAEYYDVKSKKPAGKRQGVLKLGRLDVPGSQRLGGFRLGAVRVGVVVSLMLALAFVGMTLMRRRGS